MEKQILVCLVTKNKDKLAAAQLAFEGTNIVLKESNLDYPEIQAESSIDIAKFTALQAAKDEGLPAIREDHSLFINYLGGFPGPYTNYFDKNMPVDKLLEIMGDAKDRTGYFEIAGVLAYPDGKSYEYAYRVPVKISIVCKGNRGNWDKVLMLPDSDTTFAETSSESRRAVWNKNFLKIKEILTKGFV